MRKTIVLGLIFFCITFCAACAGVGKPHEDNRPRCFAFAKQNGGGLKHQPKNVIILIADGGGFNHFKLADYYRCGVIPCQVYEDFPVRLAMSTYPAGGDYDPNAAWSDFDYVENNPTDSAAAATAMATGIKSYNAAIGVDSDGNTILNLVERAEQLNKSTGLVTSVPFSHATPAGFVVHNRSRDNYKQITADMVNISAADVIMGCGHPFYNADGGIKNTPLYKYISTAVWNNLTNGSAGGDADADGVADPWAFVETRGQFQSLAAGPTPKRVFGVAQVYETLQEKRSGNADAAPYEVALIETVPTLEEMTRAALNVLDEDPDGFFLMIEGGAVDWAAHDHRLGRLVEEMLDFNKSVEAVCRWIYVNSNWGETLVIITADHETGYLTGPGSGPQSEGPVWNDLVNNGIGNLPAMEWHSGTHTNSLVPFFAKGRGAQLFKDNIAGHDPVRGPYIDNTSIANVIFSLCSDD